MAAGAEILKRLFLSEIQPKLFPGRSFLTRSLIDDAYVNNNSVELPHAGTIPAATVDRTSVPATVARRTDVATNYLLEELTTDPTLLGESEKLIVAYNKRASILDQHAQTINKTVGDRTLYKWAAGANAARIFASTGAARAAGNTNGSQTGSRKALTEPDIAKIQKQFFADDVVNELDDVQGVAVITPSMYSDLIALDSFKRADAYGQSNIPNGVVRRAYGFDFYVRSAVVVVDATDALIAIGAAGAAGHQDAGVFYSPGYVRRAVGTMKSFINEDEAVYYGSLFSMLVRFGAAPARNDNKGVYLLFEDTTP